MKYYYFILLILLFFSCGKDTTISHQHTEKEINEIWNSFIEHWEREDTKAMLDYYTNDAILVPPRSRERKGKQDIASFYDVLFENNLSSTYQNKIISLTASDSIVIEHGEFTVNWIRNDSTLFNYHARSITHWELQKDNTWKIKLLLFNQPPNK